MAGGGRLAPMVASVPPVPAPAPSGWTIDKRQAIGAAIGLVCIGILIGFKIGTDGEPLVVERERTVFTQRPCADCDERAEAESRRSHPTSGEQSVPGDSSVPED